MDRSAAYMARYIAKNIVAAGLASKCQVSLAYAIGVAQPVMVQVDTFGTGNVCADDCLELAIPLVFGLTPKQIVDTAPYPSYFPTDCSLRAFRKKRVSVGAHR